MIRGVVRYLDERSGGAPFLRKALRYVFPDHWSFLLGEVALYRKPTFPTLEPRPALVCPCHYSTFDPARGAKVLFGPAGRPLPQLPLFVGPDGELRAAGNFSGPVGPAWWGVRNRRPS